MAQGPLTGWIDVAHEGSILMGLTLLIPVTLLSAVPLALWVRKPARRWLVLGTAGWIFAGYLFAIGVFV